MRRSTLAFLVLASVAVPSFASQPMHATKEPKLVSTAHAKFTIVQEGQDNGYETMTRRTFDNNTIRFETESVVRNGVVVMKSECDLTVEEESYFPQHYRAEKTITQPAEEFVHILTAEMFANVAVLGSELRGTKDTRRAVVPAGTAVAEVGQVFSWYQLLFWMDPTDPHRRRIQWLDPGSGRLDTGEMYVAGQETIDVLGKKTKVTVYKAERERLGPATLYVDAKKRIVRVEQNMLVFRLDEWTEEASKK